MLAAGVPAPLGAGLSLVDLGGSVAPDGGATVSVWVSAGCAVAVSVSLRTFFCGGAATALTLDFTFGVAFGTGSAGASEATGAADSATGGVADSAAGAVLLVDGCALGVVLAISAAVKAGEGAGVGSATGALAEATGSVIAGGADLRDIANTKAATPATMASMMTGRSPPPEPDLCAGRS